MSSKGFERVQHFNFLTDAEGKLIPFDTAPIKIYWHTNNARCFDGYSPELIFFADVLTDEEGKMLINNQYDWYARVAPVLLEATDITEESFTISWEDPELLGLFAGGYIFEYSTTEDFGTYEEEVVDPETGETTTITVSTVIQMEVDWWDEDITITDLAKGKDYWCRIKPIGGDYSNVIQVKTEGINSIPKVLNETFKIAPNPVKDVLYLTYKGNNMQYAITSLLGSVVKSGLVNATKSIDVSSLTPGIYMITIHNENGVMNKKFIVE